jgi:pilus assembly protein CpaB
VLSRPISNVVLGFVLICASGLVSVFSYLQLDSGEEPSTPPEFVRGHPSPAALVSVVTARQAIKRGQRITPEFLSELNVEAPLPEGAVRYAESISGTIAMQDIPKGQMVTEGAVFQGDGARPGLSILVPDGLRAVALRVNDEISVGNFIRPNDRVDILLVLPSDRVARALDKNIRKGDHTETSVLLQKVLILSTGETLASLDGQKAAPMKNITVAVSPEDALLLGIAVDVGKFYLALRNPTDESVVLANRKHIEDLLSVAPGPVHRSPPPPKKTTPQIARTPKPGGHTVTIIRGKDVSTVTVPSDDES